MGKKLTVMEIRERILATFASDRRWMGFYLVRTRADLSYSNLADYCEAFAKLVIVGHLIEAGDVGPAGFWTYIPSSFLPSVNELSARTEPAPVDGFPSCYADDKPVGRESWVCRRPPTPKRLKKMTRSKKGGIESWHVRSAN